MAVVFKAVASEPACASVSAKAHNFLPLAKSGHQRSRCSFVAAKNIAIAPRAEVPGVKARPAHTRDNSSNAMAKHVIPPPNPPYCVGNHRPNIPALRYSSYICLENSSFSSISARKGFNFFWANSRVASSTFCSISLLA